MSEVSKRVLIDMDGVMVDFDRGALVGIPEERRVERQNFYLIQDYPEEMRPLIEDIYNAPNFFEDLQPMPGLREAWQTMIDNGYEPQVASSPLRTNPSAVEGKIKWLDKVMVPEFGTKVVEDAIIDRDKWKYKGLVLIDDRPSAPRGPDDTDVAEWEHILFGWPHLGQVPMATAAFRLLSWRDTDVLLETLETISKDRQ